MTTDGEAYFFWGAIFGTALLMTLLHNLSPRSATLTPDCGHFAFHIAVFAVVLLPGALHQMHNPATAKGPRKARRYLLFILGLLPLMSLYQGFPEAADELAFLQLFEKLQVTLIMVAGLIAIWLWWFGPVIWQKPRMRRVLVKEFGSVIGMALIMAVFSGVINTWSMPQVIWVWLFMIGLIGNVILPMTLPRNHGATALAKGTLQIWECLACAAFVHIVFATTSDPGYALEGIAIGGIGVGVAAIIIAYMGKISDKPPTYIRRL